MHDLIVEGLEKQFDGNMIIRDLSFTVEHGEFFTLLGPSGCGKSTTLACLAGLERPSRGRIELAGRVFSDQKRDVFLPAEERNLGMVFQSYALWPQMTVEQNIAFPLKLRKVDGGQRARTVADVMEKVGLERLGKRYPHQLSGGQQQRVALARALAYSPDLLLLDEPLSNLDAKLRDQARVWLKRLQSDLGITTIYVTHDQEEALSLSDRIAVMLQGDMVQVDEPRAIYKTPATAEIAGFIGRSNFLPGVIERGGVAGSDVAIAVEATGETIVGIAAEDLPSGTPATLAVRPEGAQIVATQVTRDEVNEVLEVEIIGESYLGNRVEYQARYGDVVLQIDGTETAPAAEVRLLVPRTALRVYRA